MEKALILLVDDSPINLQILGTILDGTYKTAFARDGLQALDIIRHRRPDLIC
jgi:CheY-like chemotaxis protein